MMNKPSVRTDAIRRVGIAVLTLLLASCMDFASSDPYNFGQIVEVQPLSSVNVCRTQGKAIRMGWLADAGAVRSFEKAHRIHFDTAQPLPPGPFAVIELGARDRAGYGFAVSRKARDIGDTLVLEATFFVPPDAPAAVHAGTVASPCALVALPVGAYRHIQLRDPTGTLKVRCGLIPEPLKGES